MRRRAVLAFLCLVASPAAAQTVHGYGGLAIAPAGDRIAAVEPTGAGKHDAVIVRAVADGRILATIDPCAACSYASLAFAPDGGLAFVARDRAK